MGPSKTYIVKTKDTLTLEEGPKDNLLTVDGTVKGFLFCGRSTTTFKGRVLLYGIDSVDEEGGGEYLQVRKVSVSTFLMVVSPLVPRTLL